MFDRLRDPLGFGRPGFERRAKGFSPLPRMDGKRVLITGASKGLGQAAMQACQALGAQVLDASRSSGWDLSDPERVRALAHQVGEIDVLVHNAGVLPTQLQRTPEGLELALSLNLVATHRLTRWIPAPNVIWVSSGGGLTQKLDVQRTFDPPRPYDGVQQYARTKRAEIALCRLWANHDTGRRFAVMHPGWADTPGVQSSLPRFHRFTQGMLRTPAQGADTIVWLAAQLPLGQLASGRFWFDRALADTHPIPGTRDPQEELGALWRRLEALL